MPESKQTIAKLLIAFAEALDSMDDREFVSLIEGKVKLRLADKNKTAKKPAGIKSLNEETVAVLSQNLKDADSRSEAESLIASIDHPRRKALLFQLAKACDVHVGAKDNIATIERKLVENVVGTKLRSRAIKDVAF